LIPRKVHFVWVGGPMPVWAECNIQAFRRVNPRHEIKVHDETSILPELEDACRRARHASSKADLVRLSVLYREGGWYFDIDYWPLRTLREAEQAWGLDGRRVFVSRQRHKVPINNCVIASGPRADGLRELIDAAKTTTAKSRCSYGPDLFSAVVERKPSLFVTADWPWFMPMRHRGAPEHYQLALRGDVAPLRQAEPRTGGQLPYALHLWLDGNREALVRAWNNAPDSRPYALVEDCEDDHCISGIAEGLRGLGVLVKRYRRDDEGILNRLPHKPALLVAWNPIRRRKLAESAARHRVPALWCENGFYQRKRYMTADPEGFLHWSSWRRQIGGPAPEGAGDRLARFYPSGLVPVTRRQGYVLVVGQVAGDTQMADSEIKGPIPLQGAVSKSLPEGVKAYFRPHPAVPRKRPNPLHKLLPELPDTTDERADYRETKGSASLARALAGASFVITINSNAAVDALAAGVPVLALGPHLGIDAGAVKRATLATLAADIKVMLDGWTPEQDRVTNYLSWLAARQWCREEFADPEILRPLVCAAGVQLREVRENALSRV